MKKILIADDNPSIVNILSDYVKKEQMNVVSVSDGEAALKVFEQWKPDMILLDVMMPRMDGFTVCKEIRKTSMVPIIMITARSEDFDKIMGLDIGADDYIVKPFSPKEIIARIHAIFRRVEPKQENRKVIQVHSLLIDETSFLVSINKINVNLTKKEFELLSTLATYPNQVFSREHLLERCWGFDYIGDDRTVDAHIKRLRAKCDEIDHQGWQIVTIWGVGYKMEVSHEEQNI
ncbi:MAG: DNA-binding response regulator [Firmicutes bacterium HGW-Firmicutes-20]|jgi:DNA-binding response OmpR family regulator|nr:MAG: DNA-binding response regulator [Firmicutes bacterium HGW-Firmicutes-20]PKM69316.1 MAG: DNA-binding response regulator [Firmicutes bacterium HGW-Firmicutes-19]